MAFDLWIKAPNPMVTFFKTLDITNLVRLSKKKNLKFNMLMDFCIGKAATTVKEFYILPVDDKLIKYDTIAVNTIVKNKTGEVSSCDILYTDNLEKFNADYLEYTIWVAENCQDRDLSDNSMVIGTSAIVDTEIDGAVGMNSGNELGLRSACGIGTNLYLTKVALDITAKHSPDSIGFLDEETYKRTLWNHKPITDFWRIGEGTARRLARLGIYTMEGIAKS